jgi:hypothetical protein
MQLMNNYVIFVILFWLLQKYFVHALNNMIVFLLLVSLREFDGRGPFARNT